MYQTGAIGVWEPEVPTVSVGNISWGGTGKTPIAGWFLDWAENQGLTPLLLTRGYKAKPVNYPYHVLPGALVEEAGDEPLMLATMHRKANIVVDPDRARAGRWGMEQFRPKLVILDDGYQHLAVKRHVNLCLITPMDLGEGWNKVIPAGSWREPKSALSRADAFLIKLGPKNFEKVKPYFRERLGPLHKPLFSFQVTPTGVRHVLGGNAEPDFGGADYMLVTGVGSPEAVKRSTIKYLGYGPIKHLIYKDHHAYTKSDVLEMQTLASQLGCENILCTPKDAIKLGPMCSNEFWQFDLQVSFGPSTIGRKTPFDIWWSRRYEQYLLKGITAFERGYDPGDYADEADQADKEDYGEE